MGELVREAEAEGGVVGSALVAVVDLTGVTLGLDLLTTLGVEADCFGVSGRSDLTTGAGVDFGGAVAAGFGGADDGVVVFGVAFAGEAVVDGFGGALVLAGSLGADCCGFWAAGVEFAASFAWPAAVPAAGFAEDVDEGGFGAAPAEDAGFVLLEACVGVLGGAFAAGRTGVTFFSPPKSISIDASRLPPGNVEVCSAAFVIAYL